MDTNNSQEIRKKSLFTRIVDTLSIFATLVATFGLYGFFAMMGVMAADSCGTADNSCIILGVGYFFGVMFLIISFTLGVVVKTFNSAKFEKMSDSHGWLVLLQPHFAIFLYIAIIMLSFVVNGIVK